MPLKFKLLKLFSFMAVASLILSAGPVLGASIPVPYEPNSSSGSGSSFNWSGYQSTGGTYTAINGSWIVPTVSSPVTPSADATWVGIGGVSGHDLIQAGTEGIIDTNGQISYQAWYETLPGSATPVPLAVNAGDSITVSLSEQIANNWLINFHDNTSGGSYSLSVPYVSSHSSAEWIEEMPTGENDAIIPIDNFGSVSFNNLSTEENGSTITPAQAGAQAISLIDDNHQVLASPTAIGSDGQSFIVTRSGVPAPVATTSPSTIRVVRIRIGQGGFHRVGYERHFRIQGHSRMNRMTDD